MMLFWCAMGKLCDYNMYLSLLCYFRECNACIPVYIFMRNSVL